MLARHLRGFRPQRVKCIIRLWDKGRMTSTYNPVVHRFSVFVVFWTVLLFVAGALVTSKDAALSVTDWPTSHGTLVPPLSSLQGGDLFEFSHRAVAGGLGILVLVLAVLLWVKDSRIWLRWLGFVCRTWCRCAGNPGRPSCDTPAALLAACDPCLLCADCFCRGARDCDFHEQMVDL